MSTKQQLPKVNFEGKTYQLTQDAYAADPRDGCDVYQAHAVGDDGEMYRVTWLVENQETENEDEACDWENPVRVDPR